MRWRHRGATVSVSRNIYTVSPPTSHLCHFPPSLMGFVVAGASTQTWGASTYEREIRLHALGVNANDAIGNSYFWMPPHLRSEVNGFCGAVRFLWKTNIATNPLTSLSLMFGLSCYDSSVNKLFLLPWQPLLNLDSTWVSSLYNSKHLNAFFKKTHQAFFCFEDEFIRGIVGLRDELTFWPHRVFDAWWCPSLGAQQVIGSCCHSNQGRVDESWHFIQD